MYELPREISAIIDKLDKDEDVYTKFSSDEIKYMIQGLQETYKVWYPDVRV